MKTPWFALAIAVLATGCDTGTTDAAPPAQNVHASNHAAQTQGATEAMRAYADANARMHKGMAAIDRDPDIAFARGMIAHHQGALEMAETELRYGTDPEMRKLAAAIRDAQAGEIAQMNAWLADKTSHDPARR